MYNNKLQTETVEQLIDEAAIECFKQKCNSSLCSEIQYISPQELTQYLPSSLDIDRQQHIRKYHNGQWEIKNKHIHCYVGFQVISNDINTIHFIKDLVKMNSAKYRGDNNTNHNLETKSNHDCIICNTSTQIINPIFKRHICKVRGIFICNNHKPANTFSVAICLLDPNTKKPPTGYACAICQIDAEFVRYDLKPKKQQQQQGGGHRSDLCEACHKWGDCQITCVQPNSIYEALLDFHDTECEWRMTKEQTGVCCSFDIDGNKGYKHYEFAVRPYVKCVHVDQVHLFDGNQKASTNYHDELTNYEVAQSALVMVRMLDGNDVKNEVETKEDADVSKRDIQFRDINKWNARDIVKLIKYLDNGRYKKYCALLLYQFDKQEIKGSDLIEMRERDLFDLGVMDVDDRKSLYKHIQGLVKMDRMRVKDCDSQIRVNKNDEHHDELTKQFAKKSVPRDSSNLMHQNDHKKKKKSKPKPKQKGNNMNKRISDNKLNEPFKGNKWKKRYGNYNGGYDVESEKMRNKQNEKKVNRRSYNNTKRQKNRNKQRYKWVPTY